MSHVFTSYGKASETMHVPNNDVDYNPVRSISFLIKTSLFHGSISGRFFYPAICLGWIENLAFPDLRTPIEGIGFFSNG